VKSRRQDTLEERADSSPGSIISFQKRDPALEAALKRYEKKLTRSGKTRAEAKHSREQFAAAIVSESPWERAIRDAIAADRKAERFLQFFASQGHPIQAQITKLTMWAHAGLSSATLSVLDESTQRLISRDRVLKLLRERKNQGATGSELAKVAPRNHVGDLRREGCEIRAVRQAGDWCYLLLRERGKRSRKLVTEAEEYTKVARAIERLGKPPQLLEAWRFTLKMARLCRHHQISLETPPAFRRYQRTLGEDFLGFAGRHLKRWTYLMAVAQTVAQRREKKDIPDLARRLFETFRKRLIRSGHAKK
jgi:hypothetical protein